MGDWEISDPVKIANNSSAIFAISAPASKGIFSTHLLPLGRQPKMMRSFLPGKAADYDQIPI